MTGKIALMLGLAFGLICSDTAFAAPPQAESGPTLLHAPIPTPTPRPAPEKGESVTAPATPLVPLTPAVAIEKANAYFNKTKTMIADFVQVGSDGRRAEGKVYVQKPGRLRFEYAAPATLDIIADGTTVVVVDRKVNSVQQYFIWQTPLKFLLKEHIDLNRDVKVLNVTNTPDAVTILVEDSQVFGGTSRIKLIFDPVTFELKQWQVTDPQGYETLVSLFNQDFATVPNPALFQIYRNASSNTK
ncbi:MAG: outer-membrane lipoprotein carrier protein LolA [Methylovirgula sp.]